MLALTTFGSLVLHRTGSASPELRMQRRRLALLAALAAAGGPGLSRDRLLLLLWPESDAEAARNNLKQSVFALRRDLGAEALAGDAHRLWLDPEVWRCDRWEFEAALAGDEPGKAVAVYAGPFLDGFHVGGEARNSSAGPITSEGFSPRRTGRRCSASRTAPRRPTICRRPAAGGAGWRRWTPWTVESPSD